MAWAKNIVILVVCLNIMFLIFSSQMGIKQQSNDFDKIYSINGTTYSYSVQTGANSSLYGVIPQDQKAADSQGVQQSTFGSWVDPLGTAWNIIKFILLLVFGIFIIPQQLGIPAVISLMFFLPLGVAYILAIISLIRGVDF